jgi:hypothetical protein
LGTSKLQEERKVALLGLQRLLKDAEASMREGRGQAALEKLGDAFERFQQRHEAEGGSSPPGPEREMRRTFVGTLAKLLAQIDEAIAKGDPRSAKSAVDIFRKALDVAWRLDELTHASGVRRRAPGQE